MVTSMSYSFYQKGKKRTKQANLCEQDHRMLQKVFCSASRGVEILCEDFRSDSIKISEPEFYGICMEMIDYGKKIARYSLKENDIINEAKCKIEALTKKGKPNGSTKHL